jgi:hypothetical protein
MSAVTIESSEFGTLLNPADREMVDVLVSLWDGKQGSFRKETKTQGNDAIENPWINIIACTTPAWISGNFPEYMIGGGFTSRCIFIYAETKRNYVAYPARALPPEFLELQRKLVSDLESISRVAGPYEIAPEAIEWGEAWYMDHFKNRPAQLDNERFGGYIARKQTHVHKLAMVLSASQRNERVILLEDLQAANQVVTSLEESMPKVFSQIGRTEGSRHSEELIAYVRSRQSVEYTELFRYMFRVFANAREFEEALDTGRRAGLLTTPVVGNTMMVVAK